MHHCVMTFAQDTSPLGTVRLDQGEFRQRLNAPYLPLPPCGARQTSFLHPDPPLTLRALFDPVNSPRPSPAPRGAFVFSRAL